MLGQDEPSPTESNPLWILAVNVRKLRADANWSTRQFALHAGLSMSSLYGIEHGKQKTVRLSTVDNIAKAFGVHTGVLLSNGGLPRRPWSGEDPLHLAAAALVSRREALGWTQDELASAAKVSRDIVAKIERQNRNPTLAVLHRLCLALGSEVHELFKPIGTFP